MLLHAQRLCVTLSALHAWSRLCVCSFLVLFLVLFPGAATITWALKPPHTPSLASDAQAYPRRVAASDCAQHPGYPRIYISQQLPFFGLPPLCWEQFSDPAMHSFQTFVEMWHL
jgi:hypothetical protein